MNIDKMKEFMKERGLTAKDMARVINVNESTWFRKVNKNGDTVTVKEMNLIIDTLGMQNIDMKQKCEYFKIKLAITQERRKDEHR